MTALSNEVRLHLFVSFDLANATVFKYRHTQWIELFVEIMDYLSNNINRPKTWHFWKVNGDEIIFYCTDFEMKDLEDLVESLDNLMKECLVGFYNKYANIKDIMQLSLKATTWVANIAEHDHETNNKPQSTDYKIRRSNHFDFVGRETDIAFRIGKYSPRAKTSLSAALLYYLIKNKSKILRQIRIVDYVMLKGVWNDKHYPIIWFIRSRSPLGIVNSFHYNEKYLNPCIMTLLNEIKKDKNYGLVKSKEFETILDYIGVKKDYDNMFGFEAS